VRPGLQQAAAVQRGLDLETKELGKEKKGVSMARTRKGFTMAIAVRRNRAKKRKVFHWHEQGKALQWQ
jgi:hypothetical protein